MNQDQLLSIVRTLISVFSGIAIGRGWLTADQAASIGANVVVIIGALATLVPLLWGVRMHSDSAKLAAVTAMPEVKIVVASPVAPADSAVAQAAVDPVQPKVTKG